MVSLVYVNIDVKEANAIIGAKSLDVGIPEQDGPYHKKGLRRYQQNEVRKR
jgi:hypothetical protein